MQSIQFSDRPGSAVEPLSTGRWSFNPTAMTAPEPSASTEAASMRWWGSATDTSARAVAEPRMAPVTPPAPITANTRFAWVTVKRSCTSIQNRVMQIVA